eukprot:4390312-Pyramimonas_sp.AAC.1
MEKGHRDLDASKQIPEDVATNVQTQRAWQTSWPQAHCIKKTLLALHLKGGLWLYLRCAGNVFTLRI